MSDDAEPKPLSGAEFKREVGSSPEKWAQAFVRACAGEMREAEIAERVSWVTPWFRDAMEAAVNAARHEYDDLMKTGTWKFSARTGYGDKASDPKDVA